MLTLLTHNVYWCQGSPSLWGTEQQRAHPDIARALAELYASLDVDIFALQEMPSAEVLGQFQTPLDRQGHYVQGGIRPAYGGAFLWRGRAATDWSHRPVSAQRTFERCCLELRLQRGTKSLTLVNIHLASNRYAPERRGEPIRLAELAALFAAVPRADIVMGDFNALPQSAVHQYMEDQGYWDPGAGIPGPEKRIDYIWLRREYRHLLVEYQRLDESHYTWRDSPTLLSDHPPVLVRLAL